MMLSISQQLAVDYVKAKAAGKLTTRKPDYIKASESQVDYWIANGCRIPDELYAIYGNTKWNQIIKEAKSKRVNRRPVVQEEIMVEIPQRRERVVEEKQELA